MDHSAYIYIYIYIWTLPNALRAFFSIFCNLDRPKKTLGTMLGTYLPQSLCNIFLEKVKYTTTRKDFTKKREQIIINH